MRSKGYHDQNIVIIITKCEVNIYKYILFIYLLLNLFLFLVIYETSDHASTSATINQVAANIVRAEFLPPHSAASYCVIERVHVIFSQEALRVVTETVPYLIVRMHLGLYFVFLFVWFFVYCFF